MISNCLLSFHFIFFLLSFLIFLIFLIFLVLLVYTSILFYFSYRAIIPNSSLASS